MELTVNLTNHSYDLLIKRHQLPEIGTWVASLWEPQKIAIITDETVANLYGKIVCESLEISGFNAYLIAIPPGEASKNLVVAEQIYTKLAELGLTRSDGIIALGGGVVGDLAGFVASTYMRGLHFLQVPTTLLAQVDSSIGGKTAVNTTIAKNLVGTFTQPDGVLIDPDTLTTLEPRRIREGLAEVIKCAAIADSNLWALLDNLIDETDVLKHAEEIILACCEVKRSVVEQDEFDNGRRLILNFGHTIGHAIEQTMGYGVITHGEAVAIGMCQLTKTTEQKGWTELGTTQKLEQLLVKFNLPIDLAEWNSEKLYAALSHDKKTRGNQLKLIVLERLGQVKIIAVDITEMQEFLVH
ncbi:3-dehydroquinate synthase [Vagococcus penaei]|uniref:3-dehydroquinate synthase n=1 Tax=Vagococcus penaei TaxID=633807 RepID=A0A1Q2D359_9ENTE|nr:3-dehydroquinate synthase [Vagococcus penaei]AQP52789.1 3-dehydroquinate synthase [Vagococcus penaei]RSU01128.1 3-dehydroquinate synthase [Vagococcus penaei]